VTKKRRRSHRRVILTALVALNTIAVGICTNVVTGGTLPTSLEAYRQWAWLGLVAAGLIGILSTVALLFVPNGTSSEPNSLEPLVKVVSNLRRRNPHFAGRASDLLALDKSLKEHRSAVLVGTPGVGKTELAVEYAFQHRDSYDIVWWIGAENTDLLDRQLATLGDLLLLPTPRDGNWTPGVLAELHRRDRWLLVFDNARSGAHIGPHMPGSLSGHVIVTSRNPNWTGLAHVVRVDVFNAEDARAYLLQEFPGSKPDEADQLAGELGRLPLALTQAIAYMRRTGLSIPRYLSLFRQHEERMLTEGEVGTYPFTVGKTFQLSLESVRKESLAAANLLYLFAFFAPEGIPDHIDRSAITVLPPPLARAMADDLERENAIGTLETYSLIQRDGGYVRVHRLVQSTIRSVLTPRERTKWLTIAQQVVHAVIEQGSPESVIAIAPHFDAVERLVKSDDVAI